MIASMTGYGRAQKKTDTRGITVEIRSVNHRFLDCSVRAPRLFLYLEDATRQRLQKRLARGKVDVFISIDMGQDAGVTVTVNRPVLEQYMAAFADLSETYGLKNDAAVMGLARLPDVLTQSKEEIEVDAFTAEVMAVVDEALDGFCAMRQVEGARLAADIRNRLSTIRTLLAEVEEKSPQTLEAYRTRLEARMKEVLSGVGVEESRLLAEAALFADRIDVSEETVRLHSHLDALEAMLNDGGANGRKLDFLIQELNREANTIGSKAQDSAIAHVVVSLKTEIEKIREQVQNLE